MLRVSTAVALFALSAPLAAHAADLDAPAAYDGDALLLPRTRIVPVPVEPRVVVVSPLSVGGAYIAVPGLNGPTGPSAYPILPFAFGYGY